MSGAQSDDVLVSWYRQRITEPESNDEVYGYWVFVFGVIVGILGITMFLASTRGARLRQLSIALSAIALVLLIVGPIIRLPLEQDAIITTTIGSIVTFLAIVWFLIVGYPGQWRQQSTQIISLYALGLVIIAIGAVLVPITRGSGDSGSESEAKSAEIESLKEQLDRKEDRIDQLESDLSASESTAEDLREDVAESDAAVAALGEELAAYERSQAEFQLYEDAAGDHRWRLVHRNGNIIATGGQGYASRQKAQQGLDSVKRNAPGGSVIRIETEDDEDAPDPEDVQTLAYPPGESQATVEAYEDQAGEWRWRLRHENGNVVADGGEGYASRTALEEAIERVQGYVGPADYLRIDPAAFETFEDAAGEWRWRLVHRNGNILADSGEGYASRSNCYDAIESVRNLVEEGDDPFEVYEDAAGEYRWRLVHPNGEIMADSGEGYASESGARDAVERIEEYAPEADALDYADAAFEVYEDQAGEYRWRLRHRNGNILADGGEGYASRSGAIDGINSVKRNGPNADIEFEGESEDEDDED